MKLKTERNRTKKIPRLGVGSWTLGVGFIPGDNLLQGVVVNEAWKKGGREEKRENTNDVISCYLNNYLVKLN